MQPHKNSEKLRIFTDLKPLDIVSFNQIYTPVLGLDIANVYLYIYCQKQIFFYLNIESYDINVLLQNLNLDFESFKQKIKVLEQHGLAQISINYTEDNSAEYILKLFPPLDINTALLNQKLKASLSKTINPIKFDELSLLTENEYLGFELDLNSKEEVEKDINNLIVDKNIYYNFYNGIFQKTQKEFKLSDEVLEFIKIYHLDEPKLTMEQLHILGHKSLKNGSKGLYICSDLFSKLIDSEINEDKVSIASEEFEKFWLSIIELDSQEIKKGFDSLFGNHSTVDFYVMITAKDKVPTGLDKWVNDCVKNKEFKFDLLNAILSFVKVWLKKLPINYLIKMTDSLYDDGIVNNTDFINHIKHVINHDLKNRNRLNISKKAKEPIKANNSTPAKNTNEVFKIQYFG